MDGGNKLGFNPAGNQVLNRLRTRFGTIFSFEVFFAVFLFAGAFKENPRLSWIPVDLTAVALGLCLFSALGILIFDRIVFSRRLAFVFLMFLIFEIWSSLSLFWSSSKVYGPQKAFLMFSLGSWAFFGAAFIVAQNRTRLIRFLLALVVLASWLALEIIAFFRDPEAFSVVALGSNYIGLGRLMGLGVLILVSYALWARWHWPGLLLCGLMIFLIMAAMLFGGGRGPLIAAILTLLFLAIRDIRWRVSGIGLRVRLAVFSIVTSVFALGMVTLVGTGINFRTATRLMVLFSAEGGYSAQTRMWFYGKAFEFWSTSPFWGHGLGSWPILMGYGDFRRYPHNLVLEVLVELGIVGLILLVVLCVSIFRNVGIVRLRSEPLIMTVFLLVIYTAINSMVSGDLTDNRVFFAMLGLLAGLSEVDSLKTRSTIDGKGG